VEDWKWTTRNRLAELTDRQCRHILLFVIGFMSGDEGYAYKLFKRAVESAIESEERIGSK